jgi:hypothetical protein
MNETTEKLIRELAEKLGTTTEHLWGILLKQAPISASIDTLIALIMLAILWMGYAFVSKKTKVPEKTDHYKSLYAEWDGECAFAAWLALAAYGFLTICITFCSITSVVTALANPEYWALKQLIP